MNDNFDVGNQRIDSFRPAIRIQLMHAYWENIMKHLDSRSHLEFISRCVRKDNC